MREDLTETREGHTEKTEGHTVKKEDLTATDGRPVLHAGTVQEGSRGQDHTGTGVRCRL